MPARDMHVHTVCTLYLLFWSGTWIHGLIVASSILIMRYDE